ncbi:MAG: dephospho-CoA kinase [Verrucomicrobiota bacterium]|jgi:dephospho-CoA kinase
MPVIGITGGISTGKTTFCDCLCEIVPRARFFDADQVARQLANSDPIVRDEIREEFGPDIYSSSGDLNRGQLRAIVLESTPKKSALEQILHPRIRRQWSAEAQTHRNSSDFFFADIPLLYETGGETLCDYVVVVACSPDLQLERLLARRSQERGVPASMESQKFRPPISRGEAVRLIEAQMPLPEKMMRADHVVWNNDARPVLIQQATDLINLWRAK